MFSRDPANTISKSKGRNPGPCEGTRPGFQHTAATKILRGQVKEFNALNAKVAKIVTYWSRPAVSLSLLTEKKNKAGQNTFPNKHNFTPPNLRAALLPELVLRHA